MDEKKKRAIESLIQMSLELLNATQGAFLSADEDAQALRFEVVVVRHGMAGILQRTSEKLLGKTTAYGEGVTGRAAMMRKPQSASRSSGGDLAHVKGDGIPNAVAAVPVMDGLTLLGVMTAVCFDSDLAFSDDALRQYLLAADVAAGLLGS